MSARVLATVLLVLAQPAAAEGPVPLESARLCRDSGGAAAIEGCSAVIAAGGPEAAVAHYRRGNARRSQAERLRAAAGADPRRAFALALADYDAAIRLDPDYAEAYVNRGVVHYAMGDYDGAIADADAAIRLRPDFAEAFNNRSLAWYRKGDYPRAQQDFDHTIRLKQNYGNALIVRPAGSSAEPQD